MKMLYEKIKQGILAIISKLAIAKNPEAQLQDSEEDTNLIEDYYW